jgi:hypothetical protein
MSLTKKPNPIIIGGVEFPHWRAFADASLVVHAYPPNVEMFTENLGKHVVGQAEDGTNVLWLISTINIVPEGAEVIVYPEAPLPEMNHQIHLTLPMAPGNVIAPEAANGLVGQWLTVLFGGEHALCQVTEAHAHDDHLDVIVATDWAGPTLRIPEAE